ncbi:MAG: hypothetical protein MO852_16375, partial [Candidatus Devosia euplotis]|nr:hypothetical protein [Candidatus Devosia euplotis]
VDAMEGEQDLGDVWEAQVGLELTAQVPRSHRTDEPVAAVSALELALELGLVARFRRLGGGGPARLVTVDRDVQPELLGRWDAARAVLVQPVRFAPRGTEAPQGESVTRVYASQPPRVGDGYQDDYELVSERPEVPGVL